MMYISTFLTHTVQMKQELTDYISANMFNFLTHTVQMKPNMILVIV